MCRDDGVVGFVKTERMARKILLGMLAPILGVTIFFGVHALELRQDLYAYAELTDGGNILPQDFWYRTSFIKITNRVLTARDAALFSDLKHLEGIILKDVEVPEAFWKSLSKMDDVRNLYLVNVSIDGGGLAYIGALETLEYLHIDDASKIQDEDLVALQRLTNLRMLTLHQADVRGEGLTHIGNPDGLIGLGLGDSSLTPQGMSVVEGFTGLRVLNLEGTQIGNEGAEYLLGLTNLVWLDLSDTEVGGDGFAGFGYPPRLRALNLSRTRIDDQDLQYLAVCPHLLQVYLNHAQVRGHGLRYFQRFIACDVSGTPVTQEAIRSVAENGFPQGAAITVSADLFGEDWSDTNPVLRSRGIAIKKSVDDEPGRPFSRSGLGDYRSWPMFPSEL